MFDSVFDLSELKLQAARAISVQYRAIAGALFLGLALVSIGYDEVVAPGMSRLSDAWGAAATDFSRKLSSFTL